MAFVAAHGGQHMAVVDDDGAVHLPKQLLVQLRQQLFQRCADQRVATGNSLAIL